MDPALNENIIRILGTFCIERELEIGRDYWLQVETSCTEKAKTDNHDGTFNYRYKLRLATGEITNDRGESMRMNIKSSFSQQLRRKIFGMGLEYESVMPRILANLPEIIEKYTQE